MSETIFFYGHDESKIPVDSWRVVFSQWYMRDFLGKDSIYDLSEIVDTEIWNKYFQNRKFVCCEQWMMAAKTACFAKGENRDHNLKILDRIFKTVSPFYMKKLGRQVKGFDQDTWNSWSYKIVVNGNFLKFSQNDDLKKILLSTGDKEIAEASPFDKIWGIGMREQKAITVPKKLWGKNLLGKAIIEVRSKLK